VPVIASQKPKLGVDINPRNKNKAMLQNLQE
jgi:hypothetical protein